MGYQFIHVETYGKRASKERQRQSGQRSLSAAEVVAEACREKGHCPHVESPRVPRLVWGESPRQTLGRALASLDSEPKREVRTKDGVKLRGVREDTPILLAGVCSVPEDFGEGQAFTDWLERSLAFLNREYGPSLRSVVLHEDEKHMHIHFFVSPDRAVETKKLHAGAAAKSKTEACKGLRAFQDRYFEQVSAHCGLTRKGPGRRRMSRAEWHGEQAKAKATAEALAAVGRKGERKAKLVLETVREFFGGELPEDFKEQLRAKLERKSSTGGPVF